MTRFPSLFRPFASTLLLAGLAGAQIEVAQESAPGAGDFDANVLGTIDAIATTQSIGQYYGFNGSDFTGPEPTPDETRAFLFLVDSAASGLNVVLLYGEPNASFSGSAEIDSRLVVAHDPDGMDFKVYDGPPNVGTHIDKYESAGSRYLSTNHGYGPCCTDGTAIGALDGDWVLYYELIFKNVDAPGLMDAYSAGGATVPLAFEVGRRVRLRPLTSTPTIVPYCFGDATSPACPCGNQDPDYVGGCTNSANDGAALWATGSTSIAADALAFQGSGLTASTPAVVFRGPAATALPYADGLLCVAMARRVPGRLLTDGSGGLQLAGVAALSTPFAGQTQSYQCWYRDAAGTCAGGFNFTNAVQVTFEP